MRRRLAPLRPDPTHPKAHGKRSVQQPRTLRLFFPPGALRHQGPCLGPVGHGHDFDPGRRKSHDQIGEVGFRRLINHRFHLHSLAPLPALSPGKLLFITPWAFVEASLSLPSDYPAAAGASLLRLKRNRAGQSRRVGNWTRTGHAPVAEASARSA